MAQQQRSLFGDTSPWEDDDAAHALVASVVFAAGPGQPFDYLVPDALSGTIAVGKRVVVPLGKQDRRLTAYCVQLDRRPVGPRRLKYLASVVDAQPLLSPAMLRVTTWMAEHYLAGWGQVVESVVPAGIRQHAGAREETLLSVPPDVLARLDSLELPEKQQAALLHLARRGQPLTPSQLAREVNCSAGPIQLLRKQGLIVSERQRVAQPAPQAPAVARQDNLKLNPDQARALEAILAAIRSGRHASLLLHGVTGSGKTEVYIQAMQEVVGYGRQVIVLVPEISLTPQTVERFRSRFPRVAVLHSHLSDSERAAHWREISAGQAPVVVGARSAVFAPTPHLGLVILDEEHESSFKQESTPRYHARDVALMRAQSEQVPLVLGTATPSLETWERAGRGEYQLLPLPRRVLERPLPAVRTIDLRLEFRSRGGVGAISRPLRLAIEQALAAGDQVILMLNRRGFATRIQCPACGLAVQCPNCDISMTHHRHKDIALCHHCDYQMPAPQRCPACEFAGIQFSGRGTQKLEAEVRARFEGASVVRMDADAMKKPGSHEAALDTFRSGRAQILLGTQMIAKGLDFPNVTLVGVIDADTALHLPDFRAAERTFQLLAQVAGRSGRGDKGGQVIVQTLSPDHPAIVAAVRHDFETFAAQELQIRRLHAYPPYSQMVRVIVRGPRADAAQRYATALGERLRQLLAEYGDAVRVLGPAPAPLTRLKGNYRYHLQLHAPDGSVLRSAVRQVMLESPSDDEVEWTADVDPISML